MDNQMGFKSRQMAEDIRQKILSGIYVSGSHLPTCRDFAKQYGMSYVTAHKALTWLEENGYITMREHVGSVVSYIGNTRTMDCRAVNLITTTSPHPAMQNFLDKSREMLSGHGWEIREFRLDELDTVLPDDALHAVNSPETYSVFFDVCTAFLNIRASQEHFYEHAIYVGEYLTNPNLICITCNGASEIQKLLTHFRAQGRTRTAIFGYGFDDPTTNQRMTFWQSDMIEHGMPFEWCLAHTFNCDPSPYYDDNDWVRESFDDLLRHNRLADIDSIYIPIERHAVIFERLCAEHGISIPGDLAIACLGNDPCVETASPRLTHLDNRMEHHIKLVLDILMSRIRGEKLFQRLFTFSPRLCIRESSGCSPDMVPHDDETPHACTETAQMQ